MSWGCVEVDRRLDVSLSGFPHFRGEQGFRHREHGAKPSAILLQADNTPIIIANEHLEFGSPPVSMAASRAAQRFLGLPCSSVPKITYPRPYVCQHCRRSLSTSPVVLAGHNKWSKTKHIKAVTDKKKTAERTNASKLIALYSRRRYLTVV